MASLVRADRAAERPRARVDAHVRLETGLAGEVHVAHVAPRLVLSAAVDLEQSCERSLFVRSISLV